MAVAVDRLGPPRATPRELWLTFAASVLLHLLLVAAVVVMPRLRFGQYITVPVTYTVSLVDAPAAPGRGPGGRGAAPAPPPAQLRPPAPAPVPAAPPAPPAPRISGGPSDELTLPARRPARQVKPAEPPLRPEPARPAPPAPPAPPVATKAPPTPGPAVPTLPQMPALPPAAQAPAPPAVASLPSPSRAPGAPGTGTAASIGPPPAAARPGPGSGEDKGAGLEVVGTGTGLGGSALSSYLALVDWKIQSNWTALGTATTATVRFRVLRTGQVRDIELEGSSGDSAMDMSAMRAIRQSVPLPPFPNLLTEPFLDLRYRFVLERR
ncbi:MAG: energy transducer TonB [Candidatus Methylomirabilales bacterium]